MAAPEPDKTGPTKPLSEVDLSTDVRTTDNGGDLPSYKSGMSIGSYGPALDSLLAEVRAQAEAQEAESIAVVSNQASELTYRSPDDDLSTDDDPRPLISESSIPRDYWTYLAPNPDFLRSAASAVLSQGSDDRAQKRTFWIHVPLYSLAGRITRAD